MWLHRSKVEDDDTSDEEREWLEAVESGDIEEYERRKSEKNPTALTARQVLLMLITCYIAYILLII